MQHGRGSVTYPNGQGSYNGQWETGVPHGFGVMYWPNGDSFKGQFDNGAMQDGTVCYSNGVQVDGAYVNGEWQPSVY